MLMKMNLISAALAIFISGTAFAREVTESSVVTIHPSVERHAAQLNGVDRESNVLCRMRYITTTNDDGNKTTRKSVDCEE